MEPQEFRSIKTLKNDQSALMRVVVEPWGYDYTLSKGESLRVECTASEPGEIATEKQADLIILWGWTSANLKIFRNEKISIEVSLPVPKLPTGKTLNTAVRKIFYKQPRA